MDEVLLSLTWFPSGRQRRARQRTAMGLAIVPWLGRERRLAVSIEARGQHTSLELPRDRPEYDQAYEIFV